MKHLWTPSLLMALAVSSNGEVSPAAKACFDWFGTLGHPEVKDCRFAEIWTGNWQSGGDRVPHAQTRLGYIIEDAPDAFQVMGLDLLEARIDKSKPETPAHERQGFEERPFAEYARKQLAELRRPPPDLSRFDKKLDHGAEVFALAHACWRRGDDALARDLFDQAVKLSEKTRDEKGRERTVAMRESLEAQFGETAMWDAILRCGGGKLGWDDWGHAGKLESRRELAARFREIVAKYPASPLAERAKSTAAMLEKMIAEDETHPVIGDAELATLPVAEQVRELIFRLRDQNGHQCGQPGWCDVFDMSEDGDTPAHRLVKIGYPAVPQLIDALADPRLSRSVGFHRDFWFSHTVLTIGDCAQQILGRIAGQEFYAPVTTSGYMSRDEETAATQRVARAWWNEFQQKGEQRWLTEAIASGKMDPQPFIAKLRVNHPEAVPAAVLAGAAQAAGEWLRRDYLAALGSIRTAAAADFLLAEIRDAKSAGTRVAAASQLFIRDHPAALPAIIAEWRRSALLESEFGDGTSERLIQLLVASGDAAAITALGENWREVPVRTRHEVVLTLGQDPDRKHVAAPWEIANKPMSAAAREAAIALLVRALEDTDAHKGLSGYNGDYSYSDPRVCDTALWALHRTDPASYARSAKAGRDQQDQERIAAANVWRQAHHQELLPLPVATPPKPAWER
jgi:hypothetical protein